MSDEEADSGDIEGRRFLVLSDDGRPHVVTVVRHRHRLMDHENELRMLELEQN